MFQRGQRIIVVESSATKRSHPSVGDIGYLGNMYLFFRSKFILADAHFFQYKKDSSPGERCEKRRFIIDLGMPRQFKYRLLQDGTPKKFFVDDKYRITLTTVGYSYDKSGSYFKDHPSILGTQGIWRHAHEQGISKSVKIPICHIALANSIHPLRYNITKSHANEVDAWFRSVSPVLSSSLNHFSNGNKNSMHYQSVVIYNAVGKYLDAKLFPTGSDIVYSIRPGKRTLVCTHNIICAVKQIQSLISVFIERTDEKAIKDLDSISSIARASIRDNKNIPDAIINLMEHDKSASEQGGSISALTSIIFRSIMMKHNTTKALMDINKLLPWNNKQIEEKSKAIALMRKEADGHSAALNRIFGS